MTQVFATVPKRCNSCWAGKGKVVSIILETGVVLIQMRTGQYAGEIGGFNLDEVKFKVVREVKP